jgi:hypothetical protein
VADVLDRGCSDASDSSPLPEVAVQLQESYTDDVIPPTPEAELKKGRKRVGKMKDKTYLDESGYMCKYGSVATKFYLSGHYFNLVCARSVNYNYCLMMKFFAFAVTCKEYVFESCTDSEGEQTNENKTMSKENCEPIKTETPKGPKAVSKEPPTKKKSLLQKTKQATLTNFFKKIS